MIKRALEAKLYELSGYFPVISVTGPRQSGKTTLVKSAFSSYPYVSLEHPGMKALALEDPEQFLDNYPSGVILDEIQNAPHLFSYIQGIVDSENSRKFVLSGSQNFLISEKISQSLAGRIGLLTLLPFSMNELSLDAVTKFEDWAYKGAYPRIYDQSIPPELFYPSYIQTYVERDVRLIKNITNLNQFTTFLKLCAGRVGQLLSLTSLASDCGIAVSTVKEWISVLEASYVLFLMYPYHQNFNKRLVKMPKLYFYDTGLLCYLLNIISAEQLATHYARGHVFENMVILELLKDRLNTGRNRNIYFWRDHKGLEVDCVLELGSELVPVECKSGTTTGGNYFTELSAWNKLSGTSPERSFVVYGGEESHSTKSGRLVSWKNLSEITGIAGS